MDDFLEFDPVSHRYFCNAVELRSVTTILKAAGLINGFGSDADMDRGKRVHTICEQDDHGQLDLRKTAKDLRGYLHAWRAFKSISGFECVDIERRVWSPDFGYAGTVDRIGTRRASKHPVVLDIKSMKTGSPADYVRLQTAAYGHAYKPGMVFERLAVGVRPDGTFSIKLWETESYARDLAEFLSLAKKSGK